MSTPSDGTRFAGAHSDGRVATASPVSVRFTGGGLELRGDGELGTRTWPYEPLQGSVPLRTDAPDVLLSLKPDGTETLFVADPSFSAPAAGACAGALQRAPALAGPQARPRRAGRGRAVRQQPVAAGPASGPGRRARHAAGGARDARQRRRRLDGEGPQGVRDAGQQGRARAADPASRRRGIRQADARARRAARLVARQRVRRARRPDHPDARPGAAGRLVGRGRGRAGARARTHAGAASRGRHHPGAGPRRGDPARLRRLAGHREQHRPGPDAAALHAHRRARGRRACPAHAQGRRHLGQGLRRFLRAPRGQEARRGERQGQGSGEHPTCR